MTDNVLKSQAFKLKGRLYTLTALQLLDVDSALFEQQLTDVIAKAPKLFDGIPVVLDCADIDGTMLDLQTLCQLMRQRGVIPVAVQGGDAYLNTLAQCQGLAVLAASSNADKRRAANGNVVPPKAPTETIRTKLLTSPVRSGQQVVSQGGDLVVTAAVSHGAELLADGNIHVYGPLRGRALAGIAGDKQARIFCQSLDAELVSIAGLYLLSDAIEPIPHPCQIFLQDDRICIEIL